MERKKKKKTKKKEEKKKEKKYQGWFSVCVKKCFPFDSFYFHGVECFYLHRDTERERGEPIDVLFMWNQSYMQHRPCHSVFQFAAVFHYDSVW